MNNFINCDHEVGKMKVLMRDISTLIKQKGSQGSLKNRKSNLLDKKHHRSNCFAN